MLTAHNIFLKAMDKKSIIKFVLQTLITILTAAVTALSSV